MVASPLGKIASFLVRPSGIRVEITEHITKETITYKYLYPIIGGHIWIFGTVERDAIYLVDSSIVGEKTIFMNQKTWDKVKESWNERYK